MIVFSALATFSHSEHAVFYLLAGLILGWLSATVTESVGHKFTGHPGRLQRKLYLKFPNLFAPFLKPYYQHLVIHHHRTFKGDFFDQFRDQHEKNELDRWISKKFPSSFAKLIQIERYNLTLKGVSGTLPFALPFMVGPALIGSTLGTTALIGSLFTAFIPVWLSKHVHPLIHLPAETADAHPFIQWLMRTEYMRRVFRNHYLHHQELETNFNLLLGGDYLVGLHREATSEEEQALQTLLPEFDRRVRLQKSTAPEIATPVSEKAYIALENPSFEQRFQHLRAWARQGRPTHVADFGLRLYDKDIHPSRWSLNPEFSLEAYEPADEGVRYRGVHFAVGDVLLTNQASDSDGLFSTLLKEDIHFSHAALFCVLELPNGKFPAVVEINEGGVRAVPLKALVSAQFNSYIEVFRAKTRPSREAQARLNEAALKIVDETHAFDIYQDSTQTVYLNCARTIALLYRAAGLEALEGDSFYSEKTFRNLETLGIQKSANQRLSMPDDFARSSKFRLTGSVFNGRLEDILARGLMRSQIQNIWRTRLLEPALFPAEYFLNRFVVAVVQKNRAYAPFVMKFAGLKRELFPSGPIVFLSLIPIANRAMEAGTRIVRDALLNDRPHFESLSTWQELVDDEKMRAVLERASRRFTAIYKPGNAVVHLPLDSNGKCEPREKQEKFS